MLDIDEHLNRVTQRHGKEIQLIQPHLITSNALK